MSKKKPARRGSNPESVDNAEGQSENVSASSGIDTSAISGPFAPYMGIKKALDGMETFCTVTSKWCQGEVPLSDILYDDLWAALQQRKGMPSRDPVLDGLIEACTEGLSAIGESCSLTEFRHAARTRNLVQIVAQKKRPLEALAEAIEAATKAEGRDFPTSLPKARHSEDFHSAYWYGKTYSFTHTQAACVRILWGAWEQGTPELAQETILERAESSTQRLKLVFKDHPAWGTMIISGAPKGTFRLASPA